MNVLILCGGRGVIDPETRLRIPKGMILIGGRPLLWHVMKIFSNAGYNRFVLALGEGGDIIRRYFLYNHIESRDVEIFADSGHIDYLNASPEDSWRIKCVDTGISAQTGSRIARCRRHLDGELFFVTYSDCLSNVDLKRLGSCHRESGKTITVTGVQPSSRFGTFVLKEGAVVAYSPETKLSGVGGFVNGGFMAMSPGIFEHVSVLRECNLESEIFSSLALLGGVGVFPHSGYWQAVDTERDVQQLSKLYVENQRPWLSLG